MTPTPMHSKLLLPLLAVASVLPAQTIISVDAAHPGPAIAPTMFGIFFEDINFGADGGLYPELVKNGSFEFPDPLRGWHIGGTNGKGRTVTIRDDAPPGSNNRHYVRVANDGSGTIDLDNEGFFGMGAAD